MQLADTDISVVPYDAGENVSCLVRAAGFQAAERAVCLRGGDVWRAGDDTARGGRRSVVRAIASYLRGDRLVVHVTDVAALDRKGDGSSQSVPAAAKGSTSRGTGVVVDGGSRSRNFNAGIINECGLSGGLSLQIRLIVVVVVVVRCGARSTCSDTDCGGRYPVGILALVTLIVTGSVVGSSWLDVLCLLVDRGRLLAQVLLAWEKKRLILGLSGVGLWVGHVARLVFVVVGGTRRHAWAVRCNALQPVRIFVVTRVLASWLFRADDGNDGGSGDGSGGVSCIDGIAIGAVTRRTLNCVKVTCAREIQIRRESSA